MAVIKPFGGMRFTEKAGEIGELVCPPYDIISEKEREDYIKANENNIIRLELPVGGEGRYKEAGDLLEKFMSEGILAKDTEDSIYVYEMEFTANGVKNSLKGFVSLVKLTDFSEGIVLPHEETLSKAKVDRFNLMSETNCNFSQIYSLYMDEDGSVYSLIDGCSKGEADMSVTDPDGTIHKMWCVTDKSVTDAVTAKFADKKLYIADGHHRYETACNYNKHLIENGKATENSGFIAMMLVNIENDGLVVFPTHRIVRDLEKFDSATLLKECEKYFEIVSPPSQERMKAAMDKLYDNGQKAFSLYLGEGKCHLMILKENDAVKAILPDKSDAYCGLDVSVLHNLVLEKIFGIDKENMANQKNLTYTRSVEEAIAAVDNGEADCSFILNPKKVV